MFRMCCFLRADRSALSVLEVVRAGVCVSVVGEKQCRLMPPVKHEHHQYVPDLVAGADVVQLTWRKHNIGASQLTKPNVYSAVLTRVAVLSSVSLISS